MRATICDYCHEAITQGPVEFVHLVESYQGLEPRAVADRLDFHRECVDQMKSGLVATPPAKAGKS